MSLKNKKVLITSGPTWVAIDKIRIISNIATGETGLFLARAAKKNGAKVKLLLGPSRNKINERGIEIKHFRFFNEFKVLFIEKLKKHPDVVIHAAAVSDYQPKRAVKSKIKSDLKRLSLSLILTPKLADLVKRINPKSFFVIFKLELNVSKKVLINRAFDLLKHTKADLVVANTFNNKGYLAYIVDKNKNVIGTGYKKRKLTELLIKRIEEGL